MDLTDEQKALRDIHNSVCVNSSAYNKEWLGKPYVTNDLRTGNSKLDYCSLWECNLCGLQWLAYRLVGEKEVHAKVWQGADTT